MAGALAAQAVTSPTAHWTVCFLDAVGIIRWTVVLHGALTSGAQAAGMALTYATLVGAITVATQGAVGLSLRLTIAATGKIQSDFKRILKAARLDGKGTALLFGAATQLGLDAE